MYPSKVHGVGGCTSFLLFSKVEYGLLDQHQPLCGPTVTPCFFLHGLLLFLHGLHCLVVCSFVVNTVFRLFISQCVYGRGTMGVVDCHGQLVIGGSVFVHVTLLPPSLSPSLPHFFLPLPLYLPPPALPLSLSFSLSLCPSLLSISLFSLCPPQYALKSHHSQMLWFRKLYMITSRYMVVNSYLLQTQERGLINKSLK